MIIVLKIIRVVTEIEGLREETGNQRQEKNTDSTFFPVRLLCTYQMKSQQPHPSTWAKVEIWFDITIILTNPHPTGVYWLVKTPTLMLFSDWLYWVLFKFSTSLLTNLPKANMWKLMLKNRLQKSCCFDTIWSTNCRAKSQRINLNDEIERKISRKLAFQRQILKLWNYREQPNNASKYQWSCEEITVRNIAMNQTPTSFPECNEYAS